MNSLKNATFAALLVLFTLGLSIIALGWNATEDTLLTREDAISLCIRGTASGEYPLLRFPTCLRVMTARANWQRGFAQVVLTKRRLEESMRNLDASRQALEAYGNRIEPETVR